MNEGIELHDSELAAVEFSDGSALVSLSPAYVHRDGSGWLQDATVTIRGAASAPSIAGLPIARRALFWRRRGALSRTIFARCRAPKHPEKVNVG